MRSVSTVEELDALPADTVVRDRFGNSHLRRVWPDGESAWLAVHGFEHRASSEMSPERNGPFTVVASPSGPESDNTILRGMLHKSEADLADAEAKARKVEKLHADEVEELANRLNASDGRASAIRKEADRQALGLRRLSQIVSAVPSTASGKRGRANHAARLAHDEDVPEVVQVAALRIARLLNDSASLQGEGKNAAPDGSAKREMRDPKDSEYVRSLQEKVAELEGEKPEGDVPKVDGWTRQQWLDNAGQEAKRHRPLDAQAAVAVAEAMRGGDV